jgi:hypothetical protein
MSAHDIAVPPWSTGGFHTRPYAVAEDGPSPGSAGVPPAPTDGRARQTATLVTVAPHGRALTPALSLGESEQRRHTRSTGGFQTRPYRQIDTRDGATRVAGHRKGPACR